ITLLPCRQAPKSLNFRPLLINSSSATPACSLCIRERLSFMTRPYMSGEGCPVICALLLQTPSPCERLSRSRTTMGLSDFLAAIVGLVHHLTSLPLSLWSQTRISQVHDTSLTTCRDLITPPPLHSLASTADPY